MDNQNTRALVGLKFIDGVLILVLMDNQNTYKPTGGVQKFLES